MYIYYIVYKYIYSVYTTSPKSQWSTERGSHVTALVQFLEDRAVRHSLFVGLQNVPWEFGHGNALKKKAT